MNNIRTTILACIDGSRYQDAVVDYATWISRTVVAPLHFLHNLEQRVSAPVDLSGFLGLGAREDLMADLVDLENKRSKMMLEQGRLMLDKAHERALEDGAYDVTKLQRHGNLTDTLIEMEQAIRVLVIGVRGEEHAPTDSKLGAHLETVIRSLHRPILVVNTPFTAPPQRCMLAFDGSNAAKKALEMMATSPLFREMECHLVHVAREKSSPVLQQPATQLENAGLKVTTASLHGNVPEQLAEYQQQHGIELAMMGAFGHSRLHEILFGSVTHHMLVQARIPLLLLR